MISFVKQYLRPRFSRFVMLAAIVMTLAMTSGARAAGTDPSTEIIATATTYFGYLQSAIVTIGGLVLAIVIVAAVLKMITSWMHKGHH